MEIKLTLLIILLEILIDTPDKVHKQAPRILAHSFTFLPLKLNPGFKGGSEVEDVVAGEFGVICERADGLETNAGGIYNVHISMAIQKHH